MLLDIVPNDIINVVVQRQEQQAWVVVTYHLYPSVETVHHPLHLLFRAGGAQTSHQVLNLLLLLPTQLYESRFPVLPQSCVGVVLVGEDNAAYF